MKSKCIYAPEGYFEPSLHLSRSQRIMGLVGPGEIKVGRVAAEVLLSLARAGFGFTQFFRLGSFPGTGAAFASGGVRLV